MAIEERIEVMPHLNVLVVPAKLDDAAQEVWFPAQDLHIGELAVLLDIPFPRTQGSRGHGDVPVAAVDDVEGAITGLGCGVRVRGGLQCEPPELDELLLA